MFLTDLSDAAIIAVDNAYNALDKEAQSEADSYFSTCAKHMANRIQHTNQYKQKYSFHSWNLDTARAEAILRHRCPEAFENVRSLYGWTWEH